MTDVTDAIARLEVRVAADYQNGGHRDHFTNDMNDVALVAAQVAADAAAAAVDAATAQAAVSSNAVTDGATNHIGANLLNWRKVVASVRAGAGRGRVLFIGGSATMGQGAGTGGTNNLDGAYARAFPSRLVPLLNGFVPTSMQSIFGNQNSGAVAINDYDPRVTFGTGWGVTTGILSMGGPMLRFVTGSGVGSLGFTPAGVFDNFTIVYLQNTSQGSFKVNVDGGASLATIDAAGAQSLQSISYTVALGAHTINVEGQNTGNVNVIGIMAWDSTVPTIDICLGASSGAKVDSYYNGGSSQAWTPIYVFPFIAPDLTIINLVTNDSNNGTDLATYIATLQILITAAKATGDVILMAGPPSNTTPATDGTLDTYISAMLDLALANDCCMLNMKQRWGGYAEIQPYFPYYDNLHPGQLGYEDVAQAVFAMLTRI